MDTFFERKNKLINLVRADDTGEPLPNENEEGAAVAVEGSTRAPWPHGLASPLGCVALGGVVVAPVESAIAKRPVQVKFVGAAGVENW